MNKQLVLEPEEQEILTAFESGRLRSVPNAQQLIRQYRSYAAASLQKPRSINIRLGDRDLARIKALAAEQGVPYQTLISALIHQHAERRAPRVSIDETKSVTL